MKALASAIFNWFSRHPIITALIAVSIIALAYREASIYWKDQSEKARLEAAGAQGALLQSKGREKSIIALETQQRQEDVHVETLIRTRTYFDNH